ncbi:Methyltransferase-like protein 4 [Aphelenchoides fujianensis]|nr:Methyltransferase-like protein 4 [Aphelenchoides fujianensis]
MGSNAKAIEWDDEEFFSSIYAQSGCVPPSSIARNGERVRPVDSGDLGEDRLAEEELTDGNNAVARRFAASTPDFPPFSSADSSSLGERLVGEEEIVLKPEEEATRYSNPRAEVVESTINGRSYLIPPNSRFILGDVSSVRHLITRDEKFDLVVVDPPWQNKSVRRKTVYECGNSDDWTSLDVPALLQPDGLLCLWETNAPSCRKLAAELLAEWELEVISEVFWLKTTKAGHPVCDFRPWHKVPFERCVIAGRLGDVEGDRKRLPPRVVVRAVPHVCHSRKPPISEVLRRFGVHRTSGLELFARYLLPGFLSIGDQGGQVPGRHLLRPAALPAVITCI